MADIKSPTVNVPIYVGANGNFSFASGTFTMNAVAADVVRMMKIPVGTTIHQFRLHHDNLGAGTSMQVALRAFDGTVTNLGTSITTTSSTSVSQILKPTYVGDEGPSELVLVVAGTASGEVTLEIEFVATGY